MVHGHRGGEEMSDVNIEKISGTLVKTLYTTVEKGTLDDGSKYEKRQATAPRTLMEAVTDSDGKHLDDVLDGMQIQIDKATTDIKAGVNDVIDERVKEDVALKSEIINENLLKNSNFKLNTNNQTVYSVGASRDIETCDKWHIVTSSNTTLASVNVLDNGVSYAVENGNFFSNFCQWLDNDKKLAGKTITVSFEISDVSGTSMGYYIQIRNSDTYVVIGDGLIVSAGIISTTVTIPQNALDIIVGFNCNGDDASGSVTIRWVKVEEGTISTDYIVPDAETEKVRCGVADADTLDGYHATSFVRANGIFFKSGDTVLDWAINPNGIYRKFATMEHVFPSDAPIEGIEGFYELFIDENSHRRTVRFTPYYNATQHHTYTRNIFDNEWKDSKWIDNFDAYLPLTGGHISGSIKTRHIDGSDIEDFFDETKQDLYINYNLPNSHVYIYSGGACGEALHRGNSNPVSISPTAPVDTQYLWIDTINMKTKIYKDGAWTIVG